MARHRSSSRAQGSASTLKGRSRKAHKAADQSFPRKAVWIILAFLIIAVIMVFMLTG